MPLQRAAALRLVMMIPVQGPAPRSAFGTASTWSNGETSTSWPRVRKAAAVCSPSGSGRVTSRRTQIKPKGGAQRCRSARSPRQPRIAPHDLTMLGRFEVRPAARNHRDHRKVRNAASRLAALHDAIGWNPDGCARHRDDLRRNRSRGGRATAVRARPDSVQHRAVADQRARRLRRRGAGDRGPRPCRGARPDHRPRAAGGRQDLGRDRRHRGSGRAPD